MKKTIVILSLLAGATGGFAQSISLGDYTGGQYPFGITVWSPQNNAQVQQMGQSAVDLVSGSTVYQGVPIGGAATGSGPTAYGNGNAFTLAIYAAPGVGNAAGVAAAEAGNTPVFTSLFESTGGTGVGNAGTQGSDLAGAWSKNYGVATTTTLAGYTGPATFQLAAWYSGGGMTLLLAEAANGIPYGLSAEGSVAELAGLGTPASTPVSLGAASPAITSFSLIENTTPEPSTIALGVLGASALLFRRRK